ncbi:hypothetical protein F383_12725 [Gossypium arboreum]|uniref:Uncharacterized protein n=1 Tax=Gossypium arboreum TaxID=29729 RepID=A0A0B0PVK7_GOSAR|nr:hypothetical protein F383_12725 [Gossypium arboreum]
MQKVSFRFVAIEVEKRSQG